MTVNLYINHFNKERKPFVSFDLPFEPQIKDVIEYDDNEFKVQARRFRVLNKEKGRNQNDEIDLIVDNHYSNFDL